MRSTVFVALTLVGAGSVACGALIGTKDLYFDADASAGGDGATLDGTTGDGASLDGAKGDGGGLGDGGRDAASDSAACPGADLAKDPTNCGRCGHDCVGGSCTNGTCNAVTLAATLAVPDGIALDATNVYVTTRGDGRVFSIPKAGGGATHDLATGQTSAQGVVVDGTTVYWSNGDYTYPGGKGGVWKCTLPACGTPELVAPGDWAVNLQLLGGVVYYSAANDSTIRKSLPDAGSAVVATTNKPFGLAVDATYAYYTSSQPNVYRAKIDGTGTPEAVGPLDSTFYGYMTLDTQRFYWAYTDSADAGHVFGALKSDPSTRTDYGVGVIQPTGVAVDATSIYFNTDGHYNGQTPVGDGQLLTCPLAGCPASGPVVLADKVPGGGPIALDDVAVYWVEGGEDGTSTGRLRKVAKP